LINKKEEGKKTVPAVPENNEQAKEKGWTTVGKNGKIKISRPPPLILYNVENHKNLQTAINKRLQNENTTLEIRKNTTRLETLTKDDQERVKELLKEAKIEHYGQTPKEEKPFSLIIRNLSNSYDADDVINAIRNKDKEINVIGVRLLKNFTWLAILKDKESMLKLRKVRYLLGLGIKTEKYKGNRVLQCKNCQRFGHLAINCNMAHRCVKCTNPHGPGQCPLPPREAAPEMETIEGPDGKPIMVVKKRDVRCVNCGGPHPANYSKCPYREEFLAKKEEKRARMPQSREYVPTKFRNSTLSYADMAKMSKPTPKPATRQPTLVNPPKPSEGGFNINDEMEKHFGKDLKTCLSKVSAFLPKYRSLREEDQKKALFELLVDLCL